MRHSHTDIWTHLVISTKGYQPLFRSSWVATIDAALQDFVNNLPGHSGTFCIMPDHVHFLIKLPGDMSLNALVDSIKATISEQLMGTFDNAGDFEWEKEYHAHSVSLNRLSIEKSIIERQEIKHKEISVQEELKFFGM
jgi:putative transposase